jgi:hypothetical protein
MLGGTPGPLGGDPRLVEVGYGPVVIRGTNSEGLGRTSKPRTFHTASTPTLAILSVADDTAKPSANGMDRRLLMYW